MSVLNQEKEPSVITLPVEGTPYTVSVKAIESRMPSSGGDLLVHDYQLELSATSKAAIGEFLKNTGALTGRESLTHDSEKFHVATLTGDPDRLDGELSFAADTLNKGKIFKDDAQAKAVFDALYQAIDQHMQQTPGYLEPVNSAGKQVIR